MNCCEAHSINCDQGRECPLRAAQREAKAGAQHALNADALIASGAVEGPFRRTKPLKRGPVRRFFRALLAFLTAPRPYL